MYKMIYKLCKFDVRGQTLCLHANLEQKGERRMSRVTDSCRHSLTFDLPVKTCRMKMERLTLRDFTSVHYHAVSGIPWDT